MSTGLIVIILISSILLPLAIFVIVFRDLIFRSPGSESARVLYQRGFSKGRENYFIGCFKSFPRGTKVSIVAGEANPEFYTKGVARAIEEAHNRGVIVRMICGPTVIGKRNGKLRSDILDLASKGKIELYLSTKRQRHHFRVAETGRLYYEAEHIPGEPGFRTGYNIPTNRFEAKPCEKTFEKLLSSGDVRKSESPYSDFILVTKEEQAALFDEIRASGSDYNDSTVEDIRTSLDTIRTRAKKEQTVPPPSDRKE